MSVDMKFKAEMAEKVFFMSDEHFFHENIIKYCFRPYKTADEMNTDLIKIFNAHFDDDSVVFHLGDFALFRSVPEGKRIETLEGIISQLKGHHIFLMGNHDNFKYFDKLSIPNAELANPTHLLKVQIGNEQIILCHYPIEVWENKQWGAFHLHGHTHGGMVKFSASPFVPRRRDIGIDTNGLAPYRWDNLLADFIFMDGEEVEEDVSRCEIETRNFYADRQQVRDA